MKVGIVGLGTVGRAMQALYESAIIYDEPKGIGSRDEINSCDVSFVCVPTPGTAEGPLDVSIVHQVVAWLETPLIVLRSTVNPGTTETLKAAYRKRIVFQPEYLGEGVSHPFANPRSQPFLLFGGSPTDTRMAIETYHSVWNALVRIRQTDPLSAEIIKLAENRAIAHKIAEVQELYDLCEMAKVDFYVIREAVYGDDPRMSLHWTFVYPDQRGFNSKCIPKDVYAISAYAHSLGLDLRVTDAVLERNEVYLNRGRTEAASREIQEGAKDLELSTL